MNLNAQSITAFARLFSMLAVNTAAAIGWTCNEEVVLNFALSALGILMMSWSWWKNNNVTEAAQEAQVVLDEIKAGTYELTEGKHVG